MAVQDIQILSVDVPNFLTPQGQKILDELAELIGKAPPAILLSQTTPCGLADHEWYQDLVNEVLRDELVTRILRLRSCLSLVREAKIPIYFVTDSDCLGAHWELALSCRGVLGFSDSFRVGFPEMLVDLFPFGGTFEEVVVSRRKNMTHWREKPVRHVRDAILSGDVLYAFKRNEPLAAATEWISQNLNRDDEISAEAPSKSHGFAARFFSRDTIKPLAQLKEEYLSLSSRRSAIDKSSEIMRDSRIKPEDKGTLISQLAALRMLDQDYTFWLYRNRKLGLALHAYGQQSGKPVFVNVDMTIPPAFALQRLLYSGGHLVLSGETSDSLKKGLEIVYAKISRYENQNFSELWDEQVFWGRSLMQVGMTQISALPNNSMEIISADRRLELQFAARQSWDRFESVCELRNVLQDDRYLEEFGWLLPMLGDFIVTSKPIGRGGMYCSVFLKSKIFEHIFLATANGVSFEFVLAELEKVGWTSIGKMIEWDRFLSTRHASYGHQAKDYSLNYGGLDQKIWEISSLKEAAQVVGELPEASVRETSAEVISRDLAFICALIAIDIVDSGYIESDFDADVLCGASVGFPQSLGSPLLFIGRYSVQRFRFELLRLFPATPENVANDLAARVSECGNSATHS